MYYLPFPIAAVVLPAASSASVFSRTVGGNRAISAIPPALSLICYVGILVYECMYECM